MSERTEKEHLQIIELQKNIAYKLQKHNVPMDTITSLSWSIVHDALEYHSHMTDMIVSAE